MLSTGSPKTGRRVANDASDLAHLASCIHHRIYGFITRDGPILRRAEDLHERYDLRVISPADLCEPLEDVDLLPERPAVIVGSQEVQIGAFAERDRANVEDSSMTSEFRRRTNWPALLPKRARLGGRGPW